MLENNTDLKEMLERTAARLKDVRTSSGLLQKEFADMFGINPTTYNRYESGDIKQLPFNVIKNICKKYSINPAWLMGYEEAENGEIVLVVLDQKNVVFRRMHKLDGGLLLRAENPNYQDYAISKKNIKEVAIIGKAVFFRSEVR